MKCNCGDGCGTLKGLAHIGVFTANMEETIRFYKDVLGLTLTYTKDLGTTKLAFMQVGSCVIEFIQPGDTSEISKKSGGIVDHIAIEVEDIDKLVCRLYDEGIRFETESVGNIPDLFHGSKMIFFKGPNGERLELFQYEK